MQIDKFTKPKSFLKPILLLLVLAIFVNANGQKVSYLDRPVTVHANDVAMADLFKIISQQTEVVFSYTQSFDDKQKVTLNVNKSPLSLVLDNILKPLNFNYTIKEKYIIIKGDKEIVTELPPNILAGYLYDMRDSSSIAEASVYVKQTKHSAITNGSGYFAISYSAKIPELQLSFAKEDYRDTTVVVYNKNKQELYVYLFPKNRSKDSATLVATAFLGENAPMIATNQLTTPLRVRSSFWNRFRASHPNIRNISDTLLSHVSFSLVPSVSTNKKLSINTINEYSCNVLVGQSKGVTKCEVGGVLNIDNGNVKYGQFSGIGNIVSGTVKGAQGAGMFNSVDGEVIGGQGAGFMNLDRSNVKGGQGAGAINIVYGNIEGGQGSGGVNYIKGNVEGGQGTGGVNVTQGNLKGVAGAGIGNIIKGNGRGLETAGLFNMNGKDFKGLQIASVFNNAEDLRGAQVASVYNKADSIKGLQLAGICNLNKYTHGVQMAGILNHSTTVKGAQFGLINLSDSCDGVAIGLLSFVNHGYHKIEIGADEIGFGTLGFRTGLKSIHNIFFVGANYKQKDIWTYGYGLGSEIKLAKHWDFTTNLTAQQIQAYNVSTIKLNMLNKLYVGIDYNINNKLGFSFGPSANVMISDTRDKDFLKVYDKLPPSNHHTEVGDHYNYKMWIGAQLSIRFL